MTAKRLWILLPGVVLISACSSSGSDEANDAASEQPPISEAPPSETPASQVSVQLDLIRDDLLNELAGYKSERLAEQMYSIADNIEETIPAEELEGASVPDGEVEIPGLTTRLVYPCTFGGTLTTERASVESSLDGGTDVSRFLDSYQFDQCIWEVSNGSSTDSNYELNGTYTTDGYFRTNSGGTIGGIVSTWDSFKLVSPDGMSFENMGSLTVGRRFTQGEDELTRSSQIARYAELNNDVATFEMTNVDFYQNTNTGLGESTRELRVNGEFKGPLSNDLVVQVSSNPGFTESIPVDDSEQGQPLTGNLQISAADGAVLTINAEAGQINANYLEADGSTSDTELPELETYDVRLPGCTRENQVSWPEFLPCTASE